SLHRTTGKFRARPGGPRLGDVPPATRQPSEGGAASADRDVEDVVRVAGLSRRNAHARFERSELQKIPPVQRQAVNLLARDDAVNFVVGRVDERPRIPPNHPPLRTIPPLYRALAHSR